MAKPYSYDLRRQVIDAIELDGMKRCEASVHFCISRNTINLWLRLQAETGDVQAKVREHTGHSHKITDWEKFRAFAHKHRGQTQVEMAQLWEGDISDRTILLGAEEDRVHAKKQTYAYQERDEQKRAEFARRLAMVEKEQIVYAASAGMDNRDNYGYGDSPCIRTHLCFEIGT